MKSANEVSADMAYRRIRGDIVSGQLRGGLRLGETDLAVRYGLSRTPIRESLRRLQSEGLVDVQPHRGATVVDWQSMDVSAIYDLRALVEGFIARQAATQIAEEEIARLSGLCDQMEAMTADLPPGDIQLVDKIADLNSDLHGAIGRAAGGPQIEALRRVVVVLPLVLRMLYTFSTADLQRSNRHHRELLAAFQARDPEWAEAAMRTHVLAGKSMLLKYRETLIDQTGPETADVLATPDV